MVGLGTACRTVHDFVHVWVFDRLERALEHLSVESRFGEWLAKVPISPRRAVPYRDHTAAKRLGYAEFFGSSCLQL